MSFSLSRCLPCNVVQLPIWCQTHEDVCCRWEIDDPHKRFLAEAIITFTLFHTLIGVARIATPRQFYPTMRYHIIRIVGSAALSYFIVEMGLAPFGVTGKALFGVHLFIVYVLVKGFYYFQQNMRNRGHQNLAYLNSPWMKMAQRLLQRYLAREEIAGISPLACISLARLACFCAIDSKLNMEQLVSIWSKLAKKQRESVVIPYWSFKIQTIFCLIQELTDEEKETLCQFLVLGREDNTAGNDDEVKVAQILVVALQKINLSEEQRHEILEDFLRLCACGNQPAQINAFLLQQSQLSLRDIDHRLLIKIAYLFLAEQAVFCTTNIVPAVNAI